MKASVVYCSQTGNTKLLAESVRVLLPKGDCLYFGPPAQEALLAQRIYFGFWTNRGTCGEEAAAFLRTCRGKQIFLFGTAGFGDDPDYYAQILRMVRACVPQDATVIGEFMCQGKMPLSVRQRYEAMAKDMPERMEALIANFDRAATHPDAFDLIALRRAFLAAK